MLRPALDSTEDGDADDLDRVLAEIDVPETKWRLGNYEILEEIGRGGMGVIYRARQRHSRRIVALKRLLSYHADSQETLVRFRREAEAVASLDHPNILPIYEVGQSEDGLPFFSMKFATGGSLQQVGPALRKEPRQCVQLMAKVAHATEHAHSQGILHRDLKPGNILLDGRGEPLVSDFGLAKWLDSNSDLTRSLTTFGTPGYIAPEQSEGAATLTPAADVYSLGALLFDLLTGRAPFLGTHALSIIRQAAEVPAPKLRSLTRSLDRDLETICARCLERDPKARYQSAADLAADLERWLDDRPIVARPVSPATGIWRWARRNPKLVATGAVCLFFGAAAIWVFRGELVGAPEKSIAVLPFENLNHDQETAVFTELMQEDIVMQFTKVAELKVIPGSSLQEYKAGPPHNLRAIAKALGVRNVLAASVQRIKGRFDVNAQLIDASTGKQLWAKHYDCDLLQALNIQRDITKALADRLHAKLSAVENAELENRPTAGEKSVELYGKSQYLAGVPATDDQWRRNLFKQELLLNEATQLESNCIRAYCDLVGVEIMLQRELDNSGVSDARQSHFALAKQALDSAMRLDPDAARSAFIQYQFDVAHDYANFRRMLDGWLRITPDSYGLLYSAARCDRRLGRWEDCVEDFRKLFQIDSTRPVGLFARTYINDLRRYGEADESLNRTLRSNPESASWIYILLAQSHLAQGDPHAARDDFARIPTEPGWDKVKITVALCLHDYSSAVQLLASAQPKIPESDVVTDYAYCPHSWFGAQIERAQFGAEKARAAFATARTEAQMMWRENTDKPQQLSLLACMDAGAGRKDVAIREAKRALELRPISTDAVDGPYLAANLALVYAWTGERDLAIDELSALAKIPCGPSYGELKLNPKWDDLRGNPRFEAIVASLDPAKTTNTANYSKYRDSLLMQHHAQEASH
jgi:TolB-like protein/tRNA A-37 threonylcarbamoyl transferase component Bud32